MDIPINLVMDYLDGHQINDITRRFDLSEPTVYRIINRMVFKLLRWERIPKRYGGVTYLKTVPVKVAKHRFKRWGLKNE